MPKILVCDDSRYIRVLLKKVLEDAGYQVCWAAETGEEAVEKYRELRPDAVILDIVLPQMDGISAAKAILQTDAAARIIMISAYGTRAKVLRAIQSGVKDFIVKPFQNERLVEAVNNLFQGGYGESKP